MRIFWSHFNEACDMTPDADDPVQRGLVACRIVEHVGNDTLRNMSSEIHLELLREMTALPVSMKIRKNAVLRLLATAEVSPAYKAHMQAVQTRIAKRLDREMDMQVLQEEWKRMDGAARLYAIREVSNVYMEEFGVQTLPEVVLVCLPPHKNGMIMFGDTDEDGKIRINTHPDSGWSSFSSTFNTILHETQHALCGYMEEGRVPGPCRTTMALLAWNAKEYVDARQTSLSGAAYYHGQLLERDADDAADLIMKHLSRPSSPKRARRKMPVPVPSMGGQPQGG